MDAEQRARVVNEEDPQKLKLTLENVQRKALTA